MVSIGIGVACLILSFVVARPLSQLLLRPLSGMVNSQLVELVIRRIIACLIVIIGVAIFLYLSNLTNFALAIVSGTGLIGLIVGFAFKDIAENFISSLLLSIQKPFRIGDVLTVNNYTGIVNQVTSRATTLVDFDGNHIQIPNAIVYKSVIKNVTANPNTRMKFTLGIGYDAPISKAQSIIHQQLAKLPGVLNDPQPLVLVTSLGSSTVNIEVLFWVDSSQVSILKAKSAVQKNVVIALLKENISMPDDARERIILSDQQDPDNNERSIPTKSPEQEQGDDDLTPEVEELKKQAANARSPEGGANIL